MNDDGWIWVRVRRRIADMLAGILRHASIEPHDQARRELEPARAAELRQQGNDIHDTAKGIERAAHGESQDE
ncbi:MAG: hypothetical protein JWO52_7826 [Gammaproteobacteria bacterium]|nr:hypothetical protein [Gammaproteobacteria bacterium]